MNESLNTDDLSLAIGDDGIAIITIDVVDERMNILKQRFFAAAEAALDEVLHNAAVKAVVIMSGKSNSFIAGADIHIIQSMQSIAQAEQLCGLGHRLMDKIANSHKPFVAAIHGVALGGGMELALACQARVLSDDPKTLLGLPEVKLGVLPGFGGSQRLPRLIGIAKALNIMLTGRNIRVAEARKIGLADAVVPNSILLTAAVKQAVALLNQNTTSRRRVSGIQTWLLESNRFGRGILFRQARRQALAKSKGLYPAIGKILDVVEYGSRHTLTDALKHEIKGFAELAVTPEAKQLINVYFAHTDLKKASYVDNAVQARPIATVGVLGSGLMGAGIATVCLDKANVLVRIKDIDHQHLNQAFKHVYQHYQTNVKRKTISRADAAQAWHRLTGTTDWSGFGKTDLVIEAVFEDLALKQQMLAEIEALPGRDQRIFASNTSSIPIKDIAQTAQYPERVIGMHYFSPVEKMPLLEIVVHEQCAAETIASCVAFGRQQSKTVIVVKDVAGFYVNRILFPYINEACYLALEGVALDAIDQACVQWGLPVGPFKLLDEVGIDVGFKVQPVLANAYGERMQSPAMLQTLIDNQRFGKKAKRGFYDYSDRGKGKTIDATVYDLLNIKSQTSLTSTEIINRCITPLLNEAVLCLEQQVIQNTRDGDIGAVFGIGFPPFRGGPFRYIDSLGIDKLLDTLRHYQQQYGERFTPATRLVAMAEQGEQFWPTE